MTQEFRGNGGNRAEHWRTDLLEEKASSSGRRKLLVGGGFLVILFRWGGIDGAGGRGRGEEIRRRPREGRQPETEASAVGREGPWRSGGGEDVVVAAGAGPGGGRAGEVERRRDKPVHRGCGKTIENSSAAVSVWLN
jgi:hypothetical protein